MNSIEWHIKKSEEEDEEEVEITEIIHVSFQCDILKLFDIAHILENVLLPSAQTFSRLNASYFYFFFLSFVIDEPM